MSVLAYGRWPEDFGSVARHSELFRGYPLNTKTPDQLSCYTYFVRVHLTTMILSRPFSLFGSDLRTVKVELKMCGWNRADC